MCDNSHSQHILNSHYNEHYNTKLSHVIFVEVCPMEQAKACYFTCKRKRLYFSLLKTLCTQWRLQRDSCTRMDSMFDATRSGKQSNCGMYTPLSDNKHRFARAHFLHWKSETMPKTIVFQQKIFSQILSQTGFCLGLTFCLGLNFVSDFISDYIPQLYFVCNHLI